MRNELLEGDSKQQGIVESIKIKVLIFGGDDDPMSVRLEMSSEADLFFHYMHTIDQAGYRQVQHAQRLMVEFADYANVLIRMLNSCIREPHCHLAVFTLLDETEARLDFIQNMEYKFVDLMTCLCVRSPEEVVQNQITYRYNSMKERLEIMGTRLQEINNLVKTKNPSLLLQIQKSSSPTRMHASISSGDKRR